jgi:hypothetical protein
VYIGQSELEAKILQTKVLVFVAALFCPSTLWIDAGKLAAGCTSKINNPEGQ